ncbi:MAG: ROK family transcriptional regulator [Treponema sp.]|jgi:predicted NBD/HSP70 family sugar kinase|nr:ROK family transcriptional regulator [Treponema sp.]
MERNRGTTARSRIYRTICQKGETSRLELAGLLKLSMPTVLQYINSLKDDGLIKATDHFESAGGRKAKKLIPVANIKTAVGLEITRHYVNLVLSDILGNILYHERIYESFHPGSDYFEELGRMVNAFLKEAGEPKERLLGCGIALPGNIDADSNLLVFSHVLNAARMPLDLFSQYIPLPCMFINDANAAGLTELRGWEKQALVIYLSLNDSVGGSVFINGMLYQGAHFRSGEFAHTHLHPGGILCHCGKKGCVEAYLSAWALAEKTGGRLDVFFEKLEKGDPEILLIWGRYLDDLALFVNSLCAAFDCTVILGGYVGGYMDVYMADLQTRMVAENVYDVTTGDVKPCRFQRKAAALGAALLRIDKFIETI